MERIEDRTADLSTMVQLASHEPGNLDPLLNFGLNWMQNLGAFDLVAIFLLEGEHLVVRAASGPLSGEKIVGHTLALKRFPSIISAINSCSPCVFEEHDHANGEGDPFDGVIDFPHGHACMVVPMCYGDKTLGVISFDRASCGTYEDSLIRLLLTYAQILGMALHQVQQNQLLQRLHRESQAREELLTQEHRESGLLSPSESHCPEVRLMGERLRQVAVTSTPVLITGETGTGKEGIATLVHAWSPRAERPFVKINCASIPENLLESELFGVVRGAFTGAHRDRPGRFRMANLGTLFLDEIGELSMHLQAKLLRVLQEGTFEPVGSDSPVKVDVRILAATNANLADAVASGSFRGDLFYRLNVFPVNLPSLRARKEDLPQLCEVLLKRLSERLGKANLHLTPRVLEVMAQYSWPGNIRELANILERAAILAKSNVLTHDLFDFSPGRAAIAEEATPPPLFSGTLDDVQRRHIIGTLEACNGKIYGTDGAADRLGIKPSTLQSRMKKLGIERQTNYRAPKPGP